jgi:hypothetical protein
MSTQHTPGPWKVKAHSTAVLAGRKQICSNVNSASNLPVNMKDDLEIAHANARLIAAAPELLEALKLAVRQSSHDMLMTGEELRKCEAAIDKATRSET